MTYTNFNLKTNCLTFVSLLSWRYSPFKRAPLPRSILDIIIIQAYFHIFCIQEGFASVSRGSGTGEKDAESAAALKTLLSQWREKVFVMLVQQKLLQIQDSRTKHEASRKV